MSNFTNTKKKLSFGKLILWVLGIFVALQIASGGAFLEGILEAYQTGEQRDPTSPTEIVYKTYVGISGQDTEDNAGVLVTSVVTDSPAAKADIQAGDIITAMGTRTISNSLDFQLAMGIYSPWETVAVSLIRDGVTMTLNVTLGEKAEVVTHPQGDVTQPPETQNDANQSQNTAPPQSSIETYDRYPSLPAQLREHILIGSRDSGISATFTGDVLITVIFVNDPTSTWTEDKIATTKAGDSAMTAEILSEAASYGANLNITMDYRQATVNITEEADAKTWAEQVIASAGLGSISTASAELERTSGVKEAPILFYVNATERSYALPNSWGDTEYAIIWNCGSDTITYRHELYHLFGASDFYSPRAVMERAQRYCPNSTMLFDENAVTDDLTAYLIGWTDTLTDNALSFLQETAHVTPEDAAQELEKETYTGYVENWEKNGDYITGYLDFGILEGQGKVVYADGSWKEGYFEYGNLIRGRCKTIYEDGSYYEGNIAQGSCSGQGTMVWADGSCYTGQWENNQYHGYGKITYADGSCYEGNFDHGVYSGQGTLTWPSGDRYAGAFGNGNFHGYGTFTWADGNSLSGTWENGTCIE